MLLSPVYFDDFLHEEEFKYWSSMVPSYHHQKMVEEGPGTHESFLYQQFTTKCQELIPGVALVHKMSWPVMNQLPPGRERVLHVDPEMLSCVFHVSPEWGEDDGGSLEIIDGIVTYIMPYKPNRLVVFDADAEHVIRAPKRPRFTAGVGYLVVR